MPTTTTKKRSVKSGALLIGPKHAEGGIQVINKSDPHQKIEVEGGEVVITAPAVSDPAVRVLKGNNRQILSQINQSGGGVSLAKGGPIPREIKCNGTMYNYGGRIMSDYDIVEECGVCTHDMNQGGAIPTEEELVIDLKKVNNPKIYYQVYKENPHELIRFIQDQATGMNAKRTSAHPPGGSFNEAVQMLGGDRELVLKVVRAIPQDKKDMIIKAWKGHIIDPDLRKAVRTKSLATGGSVKDELQDGFTLDRRRRDYVLLNSSVTSGVKMELGGSVPVTYPINTETSIVTEDQPRTETIKSKPEKILSTGKSHIRKISLSLKSLPDVPNTRITSSRDIADLLMKIWDKDSMNILEMAYVIYLDRSNKVIGYIDLSKGGINETVVDPVIVTGIAVQSLSKNVILAHNHPSGNLQPSAGDQAVTKNIQNGLEPLGIRLLDHVIMSPSGSYYSFTDEGLISYAKGGKIKAGTTHGFTNAYDLNKAIEKLLDNKPGNDDFTVEEKDFIRYYSGYGGLEKYGAEGKGLLYEYYTPAPISETMWGLAYKYGYAGGDVCEPSAGIGEFVKYAPDQSRVDAYEINPYSARITKILYPKTTVNIKFFEELFIKNRNTIKNRINDLKKYDMVIGNPPYGDFGGKFAGMGERDYTRAANYIDYFIFRGLDLLRSGGLLVFIVGAEVASGGRPFLQQQMNACKKEIAAKADLIDCYRLPNGVFERTDVLTDIIVLKKK